MGAVVELAGQAEVQQAGRVDGEDLEAEGVFFYGFEAQFVGCGDAVVLVQGFCSDAENVVVFLGDEGLKDVVPADILVDHGRVDLLYLFDLGLEYLPQPLVLRGKDQSFQQFDPFGAGDELAVDQSVEGLYVGGVFVDALLVAFHSF